MRIIHTDFESKWMIARRTRISGFGLQIYHYYDIFMISLLKKAAKKSNEKMVDGLNVARRENWLFSLPHNVARQRDWWMVFITHTICSLWLWCLFDVYRYMHNNNNKYILWWKIVSATFFRELSSVHILAIHTTLTCLRTGGRLLLRLAFSSHFFISFTLNALYIKFL